MGSESYVSLQKMPENNARVMGTRSSKPKGKEIRKNIPTMIPSPPTLGVEC